MRGKQAFFCFLLVLLFLFQGCGGLGEAGTASAPASTASQPVKQPAQAQPAESAEKEPEQGRRLSRQRPESPLYQPVSSTFGAAALYTDLQRECYSKMEQAVYAVAGQGQGYTAGRISLDGILPEAEIRLVLAAFREDHPEVFWLGDSFSYGVRDGGTVLELSALFSPEECLAMQRELLERAQELLAGLKADMTPFERELYLHDALLSGCAYAPGPEYPPTAFTAYGALVEGEAVCEGYASAMRLLLRGAGIPSRQVNGTVDGVAHTWNAVLLDGAWYHLDPTWDDTEIGIRYDYFNITSQTLLEDHTISPDYALLTSKQLCGADGQKPALFNLDLPDCTATAENYFTRRAIPLAGLEAEDDRAVIAEIVKRVSAGQTGIPLQIAPPLDYDTTVQMLFEQQPFKFLYYLNEANRQLDSAHQIDLEQVRYTKTRNQRAVTVTICFTEPGES